MVCHDLIVVEPTLGCGINLYIALFKIILFYIRGIYPQPGREQRQTFPPLVFPTPRPRPVYGFWNLFNAILMKRRFTEPPCVTSSSPRCVDSVVIKCSYKFDLMYCLKQWVGSLCAAGCVIRSVVTLWISLFFFFPLFIARQSLLA